jgi:hypothetical protein
MYLTPIGKPHNKNSEQAMNNQMYNRKGKIDGGMIEFRGAVLK